MFNVRCSSVGKDKGAVQIQISDGKHFVALGKHGIYCRRPPKLKIQSGDDDTNLFICSFVAFIFHIVVVNTAFSDWVYICEVDVPAKF